MGILVKPYKISVWDDIQGNDGRFQEKRLGVIGSNEMTSQNRALDPVLTRTANGVKKLSFKMYKTYIDQITGQKVNNPFVDWLINERKVKLFYDNEWYDFVVKNISENSTDYLYTYQLEDAQVQELSKNGFGVTFDTKLMNNIGTAGELAAKALEETDWTVASDSEIFVEKVEEVLLKIKFNTAMPAYRIWDQRDLNNGVSTTQTIIPANATGYAFYSSCSNKPTRFQFIYMDGKSIITEPNSRVISNLDCQYYIDYPNPDSSYTKHATFDFYLPTNITFNISASDGASPIETDYKGKRVAFSQKAEYNKLLDRYIQLYKKEENKFTYSSQINANMKSKWEGQRLFYNADNSLGRDVSLENYTTYRLTYDFVITSGVAQAIGGHDQGVISKRFTVHCGEGNDHFIGQKGGNSYLYTNSIDLGEPLKNGKIYSVDYLFETRHLANSDYSGIYIQPNRGREGNSIEFQISNIKLDKITEYYGYQETKYISPAQIQNLIATPDLNSTAGWTGATMSDTTTGVMTENKATVESVYGYFEGNTFVNSLTQLQNGVFPAQGKTYKPYLKISFPAKNGNYRGVVINSGPTDHKDALDLPSVGDKWALKYTAYSSTGAAASNLSFSLKDCLYDSERKGYVESTSNAKMTFSNFTKQDDYYVSTVSSTTYTEDTFSKNSKVKLVIGSTNTEANTVYLENIELIRAYYNDEGGIISPNETAEILSKGVLDTNKKYIETKTLKAATSTENLQYETVLTGFLPVFNERGEKTRTINIKESNYFNILQTIAETFEAWLFLKITRDGYGGVTKKEVSFKNYVGKQNYAGFRYGVNVKNISRTLESKNVVTKLMVRPNSNQYAVNKSCSIGRATANPTGEDYIYDFRYFLDRNILDRNQFLNSNYLMTNAEGPDLALYYNKDIIYASSRATVPSSSASIPDLETSGSDWYKIANENTLYYCYRDKSESTPNNWSEICSYGSLNAYGYFLRLKALNQKMLTETDLYLNSAQDLVRYKAELEVAETGVDRAHEEIGKIEEDFNNYYYGVDINRTNNNYFKMQLSTTNKYSSAGTISASEKLTHIEYVPKDWMADAPITISVKNSPTGSTVQKSGNYWKLNGNTDVFYVTIECHAASGKTLPESFSVTARPRFIDIDNSNKYVDKEFTFYCQKNDSGKLLASRTIKVVDNESVTFQSYQKQYIEQKANLTKFQANKTTLETQVANTQAIYDKQKAILAQYKKQKQMLNQKFFSLYSRFIQEGTWIDEQYLDDDKYYMDALSVMYNSCYPQAAYQIDVLELSQIPGYELLTFGLGDKTYIEDPDFFGSDTKEEVVIVEMVDNLDRPEQNSIKVQTYKNQFQDLFQKITATVQQAQYSTGSYEKAVALAEATVEQKGAFLEDALSSAASKLTVAGQQSVSIDTSGLVITDTDSPCNSIHMIGGAILLSKQDDNGQKKWVTAMTTDGISASLLTAGTINTGEINIMAGNEPSFRWDALGLTAYDVEYTNNNTTGALIHKIDKNQFVRFDKHGIYGIDNTQSVNGETWTPSGVSEIDNRATFALTWEGLKVNGESNVTARIGKQNGSIINITKKTGSAVETLFQIKNNGDLEMFAGGFNITSKDLTYKDNNGNIQSFFSGLNNQDGNYSVGASGAINTWYLWNKGSSNIPNEGTFGVTKDGRLFATIGNIGGVEIGTISSTSYADAAANAAVNGLELGGRNLAKGSKNNYDFSGYSEGHAVVGGQVYLDAGTVGDLKIKKWRGSTSNSASGPYFNASDVLGFSYEVGQTYTLSALVKSDFDTTISPTGLAESHETIQSDTTLTAGVWKRIWVTYKASTTNSNICFYSSANESATADEYIYMYAIKIEKGDKATDWTEAPEDVDARISAYEQEVLNAKVTIETIGGNLSTMQENQNTFNESVAKYLTGGGTTLVGNNYIMSPYIGGGYLHIVNGNNAVIIDPKNARNLSNPVVFQVRNSDGLAIGLKDNGDAYIKGEIQATSGKFSGEVQATSGRFSKDILIGKIEGEDKPNLFKATTTTRNGEAVTGGIIGEQKFTTWRLGEEGDPGDPVTSGSSWYTDSNGICDISQIKDDILHWPIMTVDFDNRFPAVNSEMFYRFMNPNTSKLYGFSPGVSYTISGKVALKHMNWPGQRAASDTSFAKLTVRAEVIASGDAAWTTIENKTVLESGGNIPQESITSADASVFPDLSSYFQDFSVTFQIPKQVNNKDVTGFYISFQVYKKDGYESYPYVGWAEFKDLSIKSDGLQSFGQIESNSLTFWKTPKDDEAATDPEIALKIGTTGLIINGSGTFSGAVTASGGYIGDFQITDGTLTYSEGESPNKKGTSLYPGGITVYNNQNSASLVDGRVFVSTKDKFTYSGASYYDIPILHFHCGLDTGYRNYYYLCVRMKPQDPNPELSGDEYVIPGELVFVPDMTQN